MPLNNCLEYFCVYVVLNLVMLLLCYLHRKFSVVEDLLVSFHIFHGGTQFIVVIFHNLCYLVLF